MGLEMACCLLHLSVQAVVDKGIPSRLQTNIQRKLINRVGLVGSTKEGKLLGDFPWGFLVFFSILTLCAIPKLCI